MKAWSEPEPFAFNGKYNQLRYVNMLAEADPAAAPADLHPGRRLDRDVGLLPRPRLQLLVPVASAGTSPARSCSTGTGSVSPSVTRTTRRTAPRSRRSSRSPTPMQRPRSCTPSTSSTSSTGASTCTRASPIRPGYRTITTIKAGVLDQFRAENARAVHQADVEGPRRRRLRHRRSPRHRARPHGGHDHVAAPRPRLLPDAQRQPARLEDALLDASCSPRR